MTTHWINRTIEPVFASPPQALSLFPVWLLLGPRQVGKSSLLLRLGASKRMYVNLDDFETRQRANADPNLFAKSLTLPVTIDEIQYAPDLLTHIKVRADQGVPAGSIWLTGSQTFQVMTGVRESLAGRVAILNLYGLDDTERAAAAGAPDDYFASMLGTGFPKLHQVTDEQSRSLYLSSYVATYIERDVRELIGLVKRREFETFVKMCALRTGQVVNLDELGRDCGVSGATAKDWLAILEDSFVLRMCRPWFSNRSKRLIKSPKLHFLDAGLAAHLAGWRDPVMAARGPMAGALLETHVFSEVVRALSNRVRDGSVNYWRTRDGQEIDLLVEVGGRVVPIEVKTGTPDPRRLPKLGDIGEPGWIPGAVVTPVHTDPSPAPLTPDWSIIHPSRLAQWLLAPHA